VGYLLGAKKHFFGYGTYRVKGITILDWDIAKAQHMDGGTAWHLQA
jgi:hypothetical protein